MTSEDKQEPPRPVTPYIPEKDRSYERKGIFPPKK